MLQPRSGKRLFVATRAEAVCSGVMQAEGDRSRREHPARRLGDAVAWRSREMVARYSTTTTNGAVSTSPLWLNWTQIL